MSAARARSLSLLRAHSLSVTRTHVTRICFQGPSHWTFRKGAAKNLHALVAPAGGNDGYGEGAEAEAGDDVAVREFGAAYGKVKKGGKKKEAFFLDLTGPAPADMEKKVCVPIQPPSFLSLSLSLSLPSSLPPSLPPSLPLSFQSENKPCMPPKRNLLTHTPQMSTSKASTTLAAVKGSKDAESNTLPEDLRYSVDTLRRLFLRPRTRVTLRQVKESIILCKRAL